MAKFYGDIGFVETEEDPVGSGIWKEKTTVRQYYGDILRSSIKNEQTEYITDNINIMNRISIIADKFVYDNFSKMRYITWMGAKWKINSAEIQYPRLILSIGGVYNG